RSEPLVRATAALEPASTSQRRRARRKRPAAAIAGTMTKSVAGMPSSDTSGTITSDMAPVPAEPPVKKNAIEKPDADRLARPAWDTAWGWKQAEPRPDSSTRPSIAG